ncbi:nitrate reductase molybdenum cofactor assembly chaperone [Spirillospora sp. CA-294931]|uniref:nitrate reductase molybdenum cofactor assembly chaperone n=1 Tax=Spirillospora sp. CA-294931 TaxID=3240042 RepID=UPI003D8A6E35
MEIVVWRAASLLLTFPDQRFYDRRPMLRAAVADLPAGAASRGLSVFLDHVDRTPLVGLAAHYVEVSRRCSLHLTYYRGQDERRRREARTRLTDLYRVADCEMVADEPPDFLPTMLDYAALCADDWLLLEHRSALHSLHSALVGQGTPYAAPVGAVCDTIGEGPRGWVTIRPGQAENRGDASVPPVLVPGTGPGEKDQATFSEDDEEELVELEEVLELSLELELDDSDLAGLVEESEPPLDELPTGVDDLPEPRLSVR